MGVPGTETARLEVVSRLVRMRAGKKSSKS